MEPFCTLQVCIQFFSCLTGTLSAAARCVSYPGEVRVHVTALRQAAERLEGTRRDVKDNIRDGNLERSERVNDFLRNAAGTMKEVRPIVDHRHVDSCCCFCLSDACFYCWVGSQVEPLRQLVDAARADGETLLQVPTDAPSVVQIGIQDARNAEIRAPVGNNINFGTQENPNQPVAPAPPLSRGQARSVAITQTGIGKAQGAKIYGEVRNNINFGAQRGAKCEDEMRS